MRVPDIVQQFLKESDGGSRRFPISVLKPEFCLVWFYGFNPSRQLPVDIVDKTVISARAKWDCKEGVQGILAASRSFEVLPVDSIRGRSRVHMVLAKGVGTLLHDDVLRKNEVVAFSDGCDYWKNSTFYLQRCFLNKTAGYHFINDDTKKSLENSLQYQSATNFALSIDSNADVHSMPLLFSFSIFLVSTNHKVNVKFYLAVCNCRF